MTDLSYMIWFLATAAMIITVLAVGTLAAAELLPHRRQSRQHIRRVHSRTDVGRGPDTAQPRQQTRTSDQHDHEHQAA